MAKTNIKDNIYVDVKPKDLLKQLSLKEQTVELDLKCYRKKPRMKLQ